MSSVRYLDHQLPQRIAKSTQLFTYSCFHRYRSERTSLNVCNCIVSVYTDRKLEHSETDVSLEKALAKGDEHMEMETKGDYKRTADHHHPTSPGSTVNQDKLPVEVEVSFTVLHVLNLQECKLLV